MATRFVSQFAATGAQSLLWNFGDDIEYHPGGSGTRTISAMIERDVDFVEESGDVVVYAIVCRVRNDATLGISSTEIDTADDQVSLPLRVGRSNETRQIVKVLSTENGLVRFVVQ